MRQRTINERINSLGAQNVFTIRALLRQLEGLLGSFKRGDTFGGGGAKSQTENQG